jgi:hypothetical protein
MYHMPKPVTVGIWQSSQSIEAGMNENVSCRLVLQMMNKFQQIMTGYFE